MVPNSLKNEAKTAREVPDGTLCTVWCKPPGLLSGHQHAARTDISNMVVLALVAEFRSSVPMLGTRKLLHMLAPEMKQHDIKMVRDQLYDLLRFHGLLMRRQPIPTSIFNDRRFWVL